MSILTDTKQMLGIMAEEKHFDPNVVMCINSSFVSLNQLGAGPADPYHILDEADTWKDFMEDIDRVHSIKTYVYLKTRLLFDPPSNSFLVEAINNQLAEIEWRIIEQLKGRVQVEQT